MGRVCGASPRDLKRPRDGAQARLVARSRAARYSVLLMGAVFRASTMVLALAGVGDEVRAGDAGVDSNVSDAGEDGAVDAGDAGDGSVDSSSDTSTPDGGTLRGQTYFMSGGGGSAASGSHRLFMSVGAPQPMGVAENASYRIVVGPSAARP